ncbi:Kinesin-like protein NACK2 [Platanthera zijinensis]|uniref:Kinesin-like protein NACK2 n=1 Tax=Platanthera zijinensis TaxID=2320716 RepID=A0AAP0BUG9_9ASPA
MERIYVAVRPRPLSPEESETSPWRISGNTISLSNHSSKFEFDRVFGEDCKTVDIFGSRTKEIVASVVRGFNGTVFAYGQTSSGKTYTMRGSANEPGIIPLSVHELFCSIQEKMDREFLLRMSYMEIYNEEINDLLAPEHRKLQIHESLERGIYVAGLKEEIVTTPEQVLKLVEFGESHRHIGETNMNLYSSRSHTIFRMIVESRDRSVGDNSFNCFDAVRVSALNLVDLAGSERAGKTGAEGMRLKEGSHINKSLMALGTVIKKLSDGAESLGGHVPYRDSKLTRILQPALGGNTNTTMICNITLSQIHADETKSTLLFASRALQVTNCACVNEILTDAALLKRQKKEIEELRAKLLSSHSDHQEEDILNLRNTLLQSELEKERIALELEMEKKAKANREIRMLEQAKKIENLSSLILCSKRNDRTIHSMKVPRKRRLTWCPGPFQEKMSDELLSNPETDIMEPVEEESGISLSNKQDQACDDHVDSFPFRSCLSDNAVYTDTIEDFCFPDLQSLLNVTNRRKNHKSRCPLPLDGDQSVEKFSEFADLCFESETMEFNHGHTALQLSVSVEEIASQFELLKNAYDTSFTVTEECLHFFFILSEKFEIFKMLPWWCMMQLKSIVSGHNSININMSKKFQKIQLEKNVLSNQLYDNQKEIQKLKADLESSEKIAAEQNLYHEMKKDELVSRILYLQKEVSHLSSSALAQEKEALRKELDKSKSKLKDTESKLKNVIQDMVKLEGEKAQAEREIKILQGQRAILECDILKHDSHLDNRHESRSDINKASLMPVAQQYLQVLKELELCKGQCNCSRERLCPSEEIMKSEDSSMSKSSGIVQLSDDAARNEDEESRLQLIKWQIHPACDEVNSLRSALLRVTGERESLLSKVRQMRTLEVEIETLERKFDDLRSNSEFFIQELNQRVSSFEVEMQEDAYLRNKESSELRKKLCSTQAKLDAYRSRLKEALHEMQVMDRKYQEASTKLKSLLRTYGQQILDLTKQLVEKT